MHYQPDPKHKRISLNPKEYRELRIAAHKRAGGICEICKCSPAPLDNTDMGPPAGHVFHIKSRASGGDDILSNISWSCWVCHANHHGPQWGVISG